ncbi:hypothetical protein SEUCBS139899_003306 [Sporothrix eucalyptigena]|uniref:HNH nuclease domain-containing protein n=1 Tax=Sporothrix eucalyptigena TaxID=1812306 RepID=A0ABP0D0B2_9PEZI
MTILRSWQTSCCSRAILPVLRHYHQRTRPPWNDGTDRFYSLSELEPAEPGQPWLTRTYSLWKAVRSPKYTTRATATSPDALATPFEVQHKFHTQRTLEHVTLKYLNDPANGLDLAVNIPRVLYHALIDDRYFLVTTAPGETLQDARPFDEAAK